MRNVNLLSSQDKTVRTQITLTANLKKLIEEKALIKGQSLSAYLRQAALISLIIEQDNKENRKKLADLVIGSVNLKKHTEWNTAEKVRRWVKNLRKEWRLD